MFVVHDCGQIINPDGLRNQIEGNVVQTVSRSVVEKLTFSRSAVTSLNWGSYPILTFPNVPEVVDRPDRPARRSSVGCGRADDVGRALGDRECGLRRDRRAAAIGAVPAGDRAGGIERHRAAVAVRWRIYRVTHGHGDAVSRRSDRGVTSRPHFIRRTLRSTATTTTCGRSSPAGPRGALALAGLTVAILLAIWLAFFVFVFLPRGAVG